MHTVTPTLPEVIVAAEAVSDLLVVLHRAPLVYHPVCPEDGCLLMHPMELCPQCRVRTMTEMCGQCGTAVSPDRPCPVCLLRAQSGRRSMVRRPVVPVGA